MDYSETIEMIVKCKLRFLGMKDTPDNRDEILEDLRQESRRSIVFRQEYRRALTREIHQNYANTSYAI